MDKFFKKYYVVTDIKNPNFQSVNLDDFNGSVENAMIVVKEIFRDENVVAIFADKNGLLTLNPIHCNSFIGCVVVPKDMKDYESLIAHDLKIINESWKQN